MTTDAASTIENPFTPFDSSSGEVGFDMVGGGVSNSYDDEKEDFHSPHYCRQ